MQTIPVSPELLPGLGKGQQACITELSSLCLTLPPSPPQSSPQGCPGGTPK